MLRSMLFLPGNNPNMLINGNCLGADAVIFDLEDAVAPAEKDAARILVRNTLRYMDLRGCETIVRINSIDTPYWQKDLDAIIPVRPGLIMPPKTSCAADVLAFGREDKTVTVTFGGKTADVTVHVKDVVGIELVSKLPFSEKIFGYG